MYVPSYLLCCCIFVFSLFNCLPHLVNNDVIHNYIWSRLQANRHGNQIVGIYEYITTDQLLTAELAVKICQSGGIYRRNTIMLFDNACLKQFHKESVNCMDSSDTISDLLSAQASRLCQFGNVPWRRVTSVIRFRRIISEYLIMFSLLCPAPIGRRH